MRFRVGFILIGFVLCGCATNNIQTSSQVLLAAQRSIITSASVADSLCRRGVLSTETCAYCAAMYNTSKETYRVALETELMFIDATIANKDVTNLAHQRISVVNELLETADTFQRIINDSRTD